MRAYGDNSLKWKDNKLYFEDKVFFRVIEFPVKDYPKNTFWKIKFPKGSLSNEFYNLSTAKDNAKRQALLILNQDYDMQETHTEARG